VGAALLQSGTENLSGFTTLLFYLIPAAVGLGLVVAVILRRRRRLGRSRRGRDS
jgi:NhaP-type Na+/H+ or K+/H+ antiporter